MARGRMAEKFHERFDIEMNLDDAKSRFINRALNRIFNDFVYKVPEWQTIISDVMTALGKYYEPSSRPRLGEFKGYFDDWGAERSFMSTLEGIEKLYCVVSLVSSESSLQLSSLIQELLDMSEIDLGVSWNNGCFLKTGAKLLDENLVNDVLKWLRIKGYENILTPYEKGLSHFLQAQKRPELLPDVITDMYESLEALAKIVTNRSSWDLSKNRELFIKEVQASVAYKMILKEYIDYANRFRHAPSPDKPRPSLCTAEVESFIYLTGIFIRLAIISSSRNGVI
jgi:hypothetical protein